MDRMALRFILALALVAAGVVLLLDSLEVVEIGALLWAILFVVAGFVFLAVFALHREQWWALIPGFVLLSLGALLAIGELFPEVEGAWGGTIFLGGVGLAFWALFLVRRDFWWAIIPGGVLWTVALVAGISSVVAGEVAGGILFLGLGLTFALFALIPTPQGRIKWALIPAAVMLGLGLILITAAGGAVVGYLWPAALILAGLYLLFRFATSRRSL